MIRAYRVIPDDVESYAKRAIECALRVHRELGPGFMESIYRNALILEFRQKGLLFECEKSVSVRYRDVLVGVHRLDLVVGDAVVVELKAVKNIEPVHLAILLSYLKATELRLGLLMNFGDATLRTGLKRVVL